MFWRNFCKFSGILTLSALVLPITVTPAKSQVYASDVVRVCNQTDYYLPLTIEFLDHSNPEISYGWLDLSGGQCYEASLPVGHLGIRVWDGQTYLYDSSVTLGRWNSVYGHYVPLPDDHFSIEVISFDFYSANQFMGTHGDTLGGF